jgi:hypothetical protein
MRKTPLLVALAAAMLSGHAHAARVSIGVSVDGGAIQMLDSSSSGVADAVGVGGGFGLVTATGIAFPALSTFPDFATSSLDVTTMAPVSGTISIYVTEQGVGGPGSPPVSDRLASTMTTNAISPGLTVKLATYLDPSDGLFTTPDLMATTGPMMATETDEVIDVETLRAPYAITAVYTLTADDAPAGSQANSTINVAAATSIPEPGTLAIFALAVLWLVLLSRSHRAKPERAGAVKRNQNIGEM